MIIAFQVDINQLAVMG